MKNPFRTMAQVQRLARAGRPLSAALALQKLVVRAPTAKKAKPAPKRSKRSAASTPPPPRPAPGSFTNGRFSGPPGTISYKLYTPLGSPRRRMPLVVMLHGCNQSVDDFAVGTGMNSLADELGFLVLYPEQSATSNLGRCWNWHRSADQQRGSGEPALLAAVTRHAMAAGRANPARVYVAGISAGAAAAAILASAYPELFAAVGAHSGLVHGGITTLSGAISAMRTGGDHTSTAKMRPPPPTIVFHGDQDAIVHPSNATGFLTYLQRSSTRPLVSRSVRGRSAGGRDFTRTLHQYEGGPVLLEDWVVHRSGHAWSGGSRAGSHTDSAGPDASREMLRFFLAHPKEIPPGARKASRRSASGTAS